MANVVVSAVNTIFGGGNKEQPNKAAHNPLTLSDDQILEEIYSTHVHSDAKFDVNSLFSVVDNIVERSTRIADNVVQGSHGSPEQTDIKTPSANFTSPLCTLKQINSELSCKPPGEEIAHETTLAILNKLSTYSWVAKPLLTLGAFALEYGEFWFLSLHQQTEPLAKSLAIIKRVPELTKPSSLKTHRNAILEINNLVTATWQVIKLIFELDNLNLTYDEKDVPSLELALEQIPVDAYWVIITVAAIATQIDLLTTNSDKKQELSQFGQKINIILSKLRKYKQQCEKEIEEAEYNKILVKLFQTPTEVIEVLKVLFFWKDVPKTPIYDGATKTLVSIEALKKKDVFLFFSTLDITIEEISIFNPVYDHITKSKKPHKIVWIPIVEEWNDQLKNKFESLKAKMPWYVLQHFAPIKGIKYIKEKWQFKKQPMVVVLSPQGKVQHTNAFHMIQVWGIKGFPFTQDIEVNIGKQIIWIDSLLVDFGVEINTWVKEEKYVFIYGGKNKDWIQEFNKLASTFAIELNKEAKIPIGLFNLESLQSNIITRFWTQVEGLFVTKINKTKDTVTQQVEKLLSYKGETGWALLIKGPFVVAVGHGTTVLKTVAEFEKWKELVIKKGFEFAFKEYLDKVSSSLHICSHLQIPNINGKIPDTIECPECHRTMEVFISYKCCHNGNTTANARALI
ncbi:protein SIEVE ELEMENT OCCLUSION B-like [Lotus japonicus]|uniref:protein SIEVE ELEMENT OCCLUSION B-like n=1 Tax=Lotus japonicus TaxID=34305 RepID=UPI00258E7FC0|nr:protein SIEVE ELEMENT OCCLUSION B-like [Lotus japonicus]